MMAVKARRSNFPMSLMSPITGQVEYLYESSQICIESEQLGGFVTNLGCVVSKQTNTRFEISCACLLGYLVEFAGAAGIVL